MEGKKNHRLVIDPEFRDLIPALQESERKILEENLRKEGCRDPIATWNGVILDGHNRYEICRRLGIPFATIEVPVYNREEAVAWICANQLGKRNISDVTRRYLIGKRYAMEKIVGAHNPSGKNQYSKKEEARATMLHRPYYDDTACRTRERLANEYHISHTTVLNYECYTQAVDYLWEVMPELVPKILSGQIKISQENIVELAKLPPLEVRRVGNEILKGDGPAGHLNVRRVMPVKQEQRASAIVPSMEIKNTPAYDPDAEVSSLTLTIPSWVSSINRTRTLANMNEVTPEAREKLLNGLRLLRESVNEMLEMVERDGVNDR